MKLFLVIILVVHSGISIGQQKKSITPETIAAVLEEGKTLYRLESAAWNASDIFIKRFKNRLNDSDGYLPYVAGDRTNCIFFTADENPKVLATISFDSSFRSINAVVDGEVRLMTPAEKQLYSLRQKSIIEIQKDSLFKSHPNTRFNLVPLVSDAEKKVYVLSGPTATGVVVFGNDYLITFDKHDSVQLKKKLHNNILINEFGNAPAGQSVIGGIHNHSSETGELITATDICTLLLYQKFTTWQQYYVMSPEHVSIWNCEDSSLSVLPREAFEKGAKGDQSSKKKSKKLKKAS